jgi:hypothetical protein
MRRRTTQFWWGGQLGMARGAVWALSLSQQTLAVYGNLIFTVIYMSDRLLTQANPYPRFPPTRSA